MITIREWIERVRDLANRYECAYKNVNVPDMRRLLNEKKKEEKKSFSFSIGRIKDKIRLLETVMNENKDSAEALKDYANMMERLIECRSHMIPHRCDTEIVDYIMTGKRHDDTTK